MMYYNHKLKGVTYMSVIIGTKDINCPICGSKTAYVWLSYSSDGKLTEERGSCKGCGKRIYERNISDESEISQDINRYPEPQKPFDDKPKTDPFKPTVKCPYCNSTNTKKISTLSRMGSFATFGFAGKKVGKQWHCNNCKSDF